MTHILMLSEYPPDFRPVITKLRRETPFQVQIDVAKLIFDVAIFPRSLARFNKLRTVHPICPMDILSDKLLKRDQQEFLSCYRN